MSNNGQLKSGALSLSNCIMIAIGGMVGSSIFTLSGVTYSLAGPASIISWVIAGFILLLYALNVAELATTFPKSGGLFVFPYEVLGKTKVQKSFAGWISAWSWLNVSILGTAFSAIFVSNYLGSILPIASQHQVIVALLWIGLCWILNVLGISFMGRINLILTFSLIGVCLIYVFTGIPNVSFSNFSPFIGQGALGSKGILTSIPMAMLAYGSIIAIASVAEEIENPKKTIPKAMGYSVLITVVMYSLILITTFGLTSSKEFIGNEFAMYAPLHYVVVTALKGKMWLSSLVSIGALLAITTTMLVLIMDAGRTVMAVAKSGFLPKSLGRISSKTQTPVTALTLVSVVAAAIAYFPQFTMQIIGTGSICSGITVAIIAITLIVLRKKRIQSPGSFRVPGGLALPIITLIVLAITLLQQEKSSFVLCMWWYLIGLVIFFIAYVTNKKKLTMNR